MMHTYTQIDGKIKTCDDPPMHCGSCGTDTERCSCDVESCDGCGEYLCDDCATACYAEEDPDEFVGSFCEGCI